MTNAAAPPVADGEPVAVSEGVYVIFDNHVPIVPNIGIVVGDSATLVIDTGLGRDNGAYVLEYARRLAGGGQVYVATTHVDPGHGFGMAAFNITARIVFHKTQVEEMHRAVTERVVHIVATREAKPFPLRGRVGCSGRIKRYTRDESKVLRFFKWSFYFRGSSRP